MVIDDLEDEVRISFLAGYAREDNLYQRMLMGVTQQASEPDGAEAQPVPAAYADGRRLRDARNMVLSASVSEYPADVQAYDQVAAEINDKYGHIVALSHEPGAFGLRRRDTDERD